MGKILHILINIYLQKVLKIVRYVATGSQETTEKSLFEIFSPYLNYFYININKTRTNCALHIYIYSNIQYIYI